MLLEILCRTQPGDWRPHKGQLVQKNGRCKEGKKQCSPVENNKQNLWFKSCRVHQFCKSWRKLIIIFIHKFQTLTISFIHALSYPFSFISYSQIPWCIYELKIYNFSIHECTNKVSPFWCPIFNHYLVYL